MTTYRRTVNYNPATGLPITCTKPCTTYTYQARRVPYTTYRPIYTTVPVGGAAAPPATAPTMTAPVAAPAYTAPVGNPIVAPTTVAPGGCNSCAPSTVPSYNAPAYSSPSYSSPSNASTPYYSTTPAPSAADPPGATPWQPVNPGSAAPSANDWAPTYNGSGSTSDPADQKPRIDPDASGSFSSLRRPTTPAPYSTWNRADIYSSQGGQAISSANTPSLQDSSSASPTWSGGSYSTDSSQWSGSAPPTQPIAPRAAPPSNVRPLPNVEKYPEILPAEDPPLLNPSRDRTAMVRPIPARWASSTIAWPEQLAQHQVEQSRPTAQPPIRQLNYRRLETQRVNSQTRFDSDSSSSNWDQSGWRSGRR